MPDIFSVDERQGLWSCDTRKDNGTNGHVDPTNPLIKLLKSLRPCCQTEDNFPVCCVPGVIRWFQKTNQSSNLRATHDSKLPKSYTKKLLIVRANLMNGSDMWKTCLRRWWCLKQALEAVSWQSQPAPRGTRHEISKNTAVSFQWSKTDRKQMMGLPSLLLPRFLLDAKYS